MVIISYFKTGSTIGVVVINMSLNLDEVITISFYTNDL